MLIDTPAGVGPLLLAAAAAAFAAYNRAREFASPGERVDPSS